MGTKRLVGVVGLMWVLGGCGGSSVGRGCPECGAFGTVLDAACALLDRCPGATYPIAYRNRAECVEIMAWATTCRLDDFEVNDINHFTLVQTIPQVSDAQAGACAAWMNTITCDQFVNGGFADVDAGSSSPCAGLVFAADDSSSSSSGVQVGESCEDRSCAEGLLCDYRKFVPDAGAYGCQTCVAIPGEGVPCLYGNCTEELYCAYEGDAGTNCRAKKADGADCQGQSECKSDFCNPNRHVCDPGGKAGDECTVLSDCRYSLFCNASGRCDAVRNNGGDCATDDACVYRNCDEGSGRCGVPDGTTCAGRDDFCASFYCDADAGACQQAKLNGTPCTADRECASHHCNYSTRTCSEYCYSDEQCDGGFCYHYNSTCLPKKPDGQSCDGDEECVNGRCDPFADVCKPPSQLGDACARSEECFPLGYCSSQRCVKRFAPGESCTGLDTCMQPFLCMKGVCTLINTECRPAPAGKMCAYLRVCDESSYCNLYSNFTCEARAGQGAQCTSDDACAGTLYCATNTTTGDRACAPRLTAGAACPLGNECAEGLFCVGTTVNRTCQPGPAGQPCGSDAPCPTGYFCDDYARDTCAPLRAQGEDCRDDENCVAGLYCDYSRGCQPKRVQDESCSSSQPCADAYYCPYDGNVCMADVPEGGQCSTSSFSTSYGQCAQGLGCRYDPQAGQYSCIRLKGPGEACTGGDQCVSGACYSEYGCLTTNECIPP